MRLLAEAYEQVDTQYVREVDRRRLVDAAIRGMLKELDPYSTWIAPDELGRFEQYLEQEFVGVGIQVQSAGGRLEIVTVLRDSPAWRAGVRQSDLLVEVNGTQVSMLSPAEVSKLISGPLGRSVTLGVRHPGQED
jgi:carboxyl-terminal processing protease